MNKVQEIMPSKQAGLFDFVDESKVGVGYLDWIDEEFWVKASGDVACLQEAIDKKTVLHVRWPSHIKDGKTKASVNIVPAILLKTGKWEDMCSSRDDIDKYDTLNPSKYDRKRICDRRSHEDVAESKTSHVKPQVEKISKKKKDASKRESQQLLMGRVKNETKNKKRLDDNPDSGDQVKRLRHNKVSNQSKPTPSHKNSTDQPKSPDDPLRIVSDQLSKMTELMDTLPALVETAIANKMSHTVQKFKEYEDMLFAIQDIVKTFDNKLSTIENKIQSLQVQDTILWNEIDCIMSGTSMNCEGKMRPSAGTAMESTKAYVDGSELPKRIDHNKSTSSLVLSSETQSHSSMRKLQAQKVSEGPVLEQLSSIGTSSSIQSAPQAPIFARNDTRSSKTSTNESRPPKLDMKNQSTTGPSASVKELATPKISQHCVSAEVTLNHNGSSSQSSHSPQVANSYDIMEIDLDVLNEEPEGYVHLHSVKSEFSAPLFEFKDVDEPFDKHLDDDEDELKTRKLVKNPISTQATVKSSTNLIDESKTFISIGGQLVDKKRIDLCNDSKISKLVNELMVILFTAEEMGNSSLTGKVSNIHLKRSASEIRQKKQLDPTKIKGLYDYILDQKPNCTKKEITTAIQLKLKYEATKLHGGVGFKRAKQADK